MLGERMCAVPTRGPGCLFRTQDSSVIPRPLSCSRGLPSPKTRPRRPCSRMRSSIPSQTASQIRAEPAGRWSPPGALGAPAPEPRSRSSGKALTCKPVAAAAAASPAPTHRPRSLGDRLTPRELGRPADPSSDSNSAAVGGRRHSQSECEEAARRRAGPRKWKPEGAGRAAAERNSGRG